ncbi:MAG: LCP family protein, partial [Ornithinimicrobium sp.]
MPRRPEDDWTRPMPRTSRQSGAAQGRNEWSDPQWPQRDDSDPDWRIDSRATRRTRDEYSGAEQYGNDLYGNDQYTDQQWQEPVYTAPYADQPPPRRPGRRRPRYGFRRFTVIVVLIIVAYLAAMIWAVSASYFAIGEVDATPERDARPSSGSGSNVLLVGTDSREDLTEEQRNDLNTGGVEGSRADTIMLLHLPTSDDPTLLSLPRDSYVDIPGSGMNKINAAYSIGGPALLVDTVEQATDLRVDG